MTPEDKDKITKNLSLLTSKTKWSSDLEVKLLENEVYTQKAISLLLDEPKDEAKVRKLYDTVKKRGPKAFHNLVKSLVQSGNFETAKILDDSIETPKQQKQVQRNEKVWQEPTYDPPPPLNLPSPDEAPYVQYIDDKTPLQVKVKRSLSYKGPPKLKAYPMNATPRGYALIVDNEEFDNDILTKREGSLIDANNLDILFEELGFKVTLRRNLDYNDLMSTITAFARLTDHAKANMAIVAILSHGESGLISSRDGRQVPTEWLLRQFNNEGCPALKGKPKFFILQACRGDEADYGHDVPSISMNNSSSTDVDAQGFKNPPNTIAREPSWEDMLIAYATIPGYVANRNLYRGTWFVESICKVFMDHAHEMDIREMLDEVSNQLRYYESEYGTKQSCSYEVRHFYKKLYFNPGLSEEMIEQLSTVTTKGQNENGSLSR